MAKVPSYQPQVQANLGQAQQVNVQTNQEAFGGGQDPRALQQATGSVVDAFAQYRMQSDEVAVTEADGKASKTVNELIFNPKDGFMAKKGKDAFGIEKDYVPAFQKSMDQIESSLSNDRQKALFGARKAQYALKFEADMQKHMSAQGTAYDKEVTDSRIAVAKNDALLNFADQDAVKNAVNTQRGVIENFAKRNGMSPEWTQNEISKNVSETHISIVDRMVDLDQPNQAKEYFELYKGEISGKDQARIEKNLKTGSIKLESQIASEAIFNKGLSVGAALEEARKIENPELKDETVRRVKDRYAEIGENERIQNDINVNAARRGLAQNGGNIDAAISPTALAALPLEAQKGLAIQASMIKTGRPFVTDADARYALELQMSADPEKFRTVDLIGAYGHKLSESDLEYFMKAQGNIAKGTAEGDKLRNGVLTKQQILDQSLVEFGINPKDKAKKDSVAQLNLRINDAIVQYQDDTGKAAGPKEIREITESFLVEARRGGGRFPSFGELISGKRELTLSDVFGGSVPLYDIDPANADYTVPYENISINTRRRIESALKQAGRPVTPQNVEAAFKERAKALRGQN